MLFHKRFFVALPHIHTNDNPYPDADSKRHTHGELIFGNILNKSQMLCRIAGWAQFEIKIEGIRTQLDACRI